MPIDGATRKGEVSAFVSAREVQGAKKQSLRFLAIRDEFVDTELSGMLRPPVKIYVPGMGPRQPFADSRRYGMRQVLGALLVAVTAIAVPARVSASPIVITFETLSAFDLETDSNFIQPLTNQFAGDGVGFDSGWAWFALFSLNETDFPPFSGDAVASNASYDGAGNLVPGSLDIALTQPYYSVGGYFTHSSLLSLEAFNGVDSLGTIYSSTESNLQTSTFIEFAASMPITRLLVTSAGTQFTLDDLTLTPDAPGPTPVPDKADSVLLLGAVLACLCLRAEAAQFVVGKPRRRKSSISA